MSPNIRQQTPDPNQPARQSHSPPESHPSMGGHSMTDSFSGGAMPTAQNYEVHEVSSSTFSEHVPQISESLTDISNSTHMSLNPQFPPHGLNIPPITESSANWIPEIGTNPPYTSMNNSLPVATTTSHLQQSYPSQHQHLGHVPSPHMVAGYHPAGQMTPDTILTTTYQSAISSVNTMPQMAMQPTMGSMHPPMTIPGQPGGPMMGTRISPPHRESSEDSDDNTPLSQVRTIPYFILGPGGGGWGGGHSFAQLLCYFIICLQPAITINVWCLLYHNKVFVSFVLS